MTVENHFKNGAMQQQEYKSLRISTAHLADCPLSEELSWARTNLVRDAVCPALCIAGDSCTLLSGKSIGTAIKIKTS